MNDINKTLKNWLDELSKFQFQEYEKFPDIELYMDQVITYLERQLSVLQTSSLDKQITSSMINNYVKGEILYAPIQKKYNREHLSQIEEICILKQVLSIAEIKQLISCRYKEESHNQIFNNFKELHSKANEEASLFAENKLKEIKTNDIKELTNLSLQLSLIADSYITIAKRILFLTRTYEEFQSDKLMDDSDKKKKKKHEEKDETNQEQ